MKPVRNPGYRQWIRSLPCCVCRTTRAVEVAHTGPRGLSQKSSDFAAIPLCARHHRIGKDSYHKLGPRKFAEVHHVNLLAIVARLSARTVIRVRSGTFVGSSGDEEYLLGRTVIGIRQTVRRMYESSVMRNSGILSRWRLEV